MRSSEALTELLNQHSVSEENGFSPFRLWIDGLKRLVFVRVLDKPNPMYPDGKDEVRYVVETPPKRSKVRLVISKWNQSNPYEGDVLATDAGDLWGMSLRQRLVKQVYKRDWKLSELVAKDLAELAPQIAYYRENRERILLESIRKSDHAERKQRLLKIEQGQQEFSPKTLNLLAFIDALPADVPENEPCQARFTLQQLAGKKGDTIDAVRHRFTPLERQPYLRIVRESRGNQPTVYGYLKEKRGMKAVTTREQTTTSDTTIVKGQSAPRNPLRYESEGLVRYGEKGRRYKFT